MRRMAETAVLVTPSGGLGQQLMLLPLGATAIKPDVLRDDGQSLPLDLPDYAHVDHVNVLRLAVSSKDYTKTTDRPDCESAPPKLRNCNVWLTDLVPLFHMVEQALHTWCLDHEV